MARFCIHCGKEINENAIICIHCGCSVQSPETNVPSHRFPVSLILGIIGIITAWIFALVGHITSITGIVLGIKEYKESDRVSGIVLSVIGEACSLLSSFIGIIYAASILN